MPANLTPDYHRAEEAFRAARTLDEKIERLRDMIAVLPKHKGTDHLHADLKRRLSKLHKELEESDQKAGRGASFAIEREGAAQVVLLGPPNSGKSSVMAALTDAHVEVADYPFSTTRMHPGMVRYEDIQIQLVDSPPVTAEYMPAHLLGVVRGADLALLVLDLATDSVLEELGTILKAFAERHVAFVRKSSRGERDRVPARILANKADAEGAGFRLELLRDMAGGELDAHPLSCAPGGDVGELPAHLFRWLGIVRVYTKVPGKPPDLERPYTVFEGQTVLDICARVHRDFAEKLRFARLWRGEHEPLTVSREAVVRDGDVVELHL